MEPQTETVYVLRRLRPSDWDRRVHEVKVSAFTLREEEMGISVYSEEAKTREELKVRSFYSNLPNYLKVKGVCTAYESGFGKGLAQSKDGNPYVPESDECIAYDIGYYEGYERWRENQKQSKSSGA